LDSITEIKSEQMSEKNEKLMYLFRKKKKEKKILIKNDKKSTKYIYFLKRLYCAVLCSLDGYIRTNWIKWYLNRESA
jgi:hypothetical protein